jgi:hypothetical protein
MNEAERLREAGFNDDDIAEYMAANKKSPAVSTSTNPQFSGSELQAVDETPLPIPQRETTFGAGVATGMMAGSDLWDKGMDLAKLVIPTYGGYKSYQLARKFLENKSVPPTPPTTPPGGGGGGKYTFSVPSQPTTTIYNGPNQYEMRPKPQEWKTGTTGSATQQGSKVAGAANNAAGKAASGFARLSMLDFLNRAFMAGGLALHSSGLNEGEDEELARRRAMPISPNRRY